MYRVLKLLLILQKKNRELSKKLFFRQLTPRQLEMRMVCCYTLHSLNHYIGQVYSVIRHIPLRETIE